MAWRGDSELNLRTSMFCLIICRCTLRTGRSSSRAISPGCCSPRTRSPAMRGTSRAGRSKPPIATENLLEDTDGVLRLHQCSLGAAACYLLCMLTAALLMTSSHSERLSWCDYLIKIQHNITTSTGEHGGYWDTGMGEVYLADTGPVETPSLSNREPAREH